MLDQPNTTAVLLVNLGTPDSYQVKDVRRYLAEFLMDKYVLDVPYVLRWILVYALILPFRPKKSAEAYQSIWWKEGSPLMVLSERLLKVCQEKIKVPTVLGMRYAKPSIKHGINQLYKQSPHLKKIVLVPLYPHYAMASYETVVEKTKQVIDRYHPDLIFETVPPFYQKASYIAALSSSIKPFLDKIDHLLISYHGIPVRHLKKCDTTKNHCYKQNKCCHTASETHKTCYKHQCVSTTQSVVQTLNLSDDKWSISFQSRLLSDPWIEPFTDKRIEALAKQGVKRLAVVCPAFVSDNLETLEEMGEEGKKIFLDNGGESFYLIPCLNTEPAWVDALVAMIQERVS